LIDRVICIKFGNLQKYNFPLFDLGCLLLLSSSECKEEGALLTQCKLLWLSQRLDWLWSLLFFLSLTSQSQSTEVSTTAHLLLRTYQTNQDASSFDFVKLPNRRLHISW